MLVELAIGDAYGIAYEFNTDNDDKNDLAKYRAHPLFNIKDSYGTGAGQYTDDTQMSIGVAEAILSGKPLTAKLFAEHFVQAFKRDPRAGYAPRFYEFLQSVVDADDFMDRIKNDSRRNGSAMRSGPLGFLPDVSQVLAVAEIQAGVTHNTSDGIMGSQAIALMCHYMVYDLGPKVDLGSFLNHYLDSSVDWSSEHVGKISINAVEAAHAAVSLVQRYSSMKEILWHAVNLGGDTDSGASMALAGASMSVEVLQDLPDHFHAELENDQFGYDYLTELDIKLRDKFNV